MRRTNFVLPGTRLKIPLRLYKTRNGSDRGWRASAQLCRVAIGRILLLFWSKSRSAPTGASLGGFLRRSGNLATTFCPSFRPPPAASHSGGAQSSFGPSAPSTLSARASIDRLLWCSAWSGPVAGSADRRRRLASLSCERLETGRRRRRSAPRSFRPSGARRARPRRARRARIRFRPVPALTARTAKRLPVPEIALCGGKFAPRSKRI